MDFFKNTKLDDMCQLLSKFSIFNIEVSFQQMYLWMSVITLWKWTNSQDYRMLLLKGILETM